MTTPPKLIFVFYPYTKTCFVYFVRDVPSTSQLVCCTKVKELIFALDSIFEISAQQSSTLVAETIDITAPLVTDSESIQIIHEIHDRIELLKKRGISIRTIRHELLKLQPPSHLILGIDNKLILSDYGNLEIKLKPLAKALYILFLHHPEGIVLKQISNYSGELIKIYQDLVPTHNPEHMTNSIRNICCPLHNSLNEKIAQIRSSILDVLDENISPLYTINGVKGGIYSIPLPRHFLK